MSSTAANQLTVGESMRQENGSTKIWLDGPGQQCVKTSDCLFQPHTATLIVPKTGKVWHYEGNVWNDIILAELRGRFRGRRSYHEAPFPTPWRDSALLPSDATKARWAGLHVLGRVLHRAAAVPAADDTHHWTCSIITRQTVHTINLSHVTYSKVYNININIIVI